MTASPFINNHNVLKLAKKMRVRTRRVHPCDYSPRRDSNVRVFRSTRNDTSMRGHRHYKKHKLMTHPYGIQRSCWFTCGSRLAAARVCLGITSDGLQLVGTCCCHGNSMLVAYTHGINGNTDSHHTYMTLRTTTSVMCAQTFLFSFARELHPQLLV